MRVRRETGLEGRLPGATALPGGTKGYEAPAADVPRPGDLARLASTLPDTLLFQLVTEIAPSPDRGWTQGRWLTFVGGNAERLVGVDAETLMADGTQVYAMMHEEDRALFAAAEAHAVAEGKPLRLDVRMKPPGSGETQVFDVSASPTVLPPTRPGGLRMLWDGAATDVTRARRDAAERERMTGIVEAADDLIAIVRLTGGVDYVNPAGRRMLGLGADDAPPVASTLWPGGAKGERMRHAIRTATRTGLWKGEASLRHLSGTELPVSQTLVAHRAPPAPGRKLGRVTHFSVIMRDATRAADTEKALREAGERISIELRENEHRVKNLFALVPAIVSLSARTAGSVDDFAEAMRERLGALGRANAASLGSGTTSMDTLVRTVLAPYLRNDGTVRLEGPPISLTGTAATTVGLTLHELTTNAVKYGAMREGDGRLAVSWSEGTADVLQVTWTESGGPRVTAPTRTGVGTSLIDRVIAAQGGSISRDWNEDGLRVHLSMPVR